VFSISISATKEDLMKINGIGDAISDRILKAKRSFWPGFVSMEQMNDVWGLQPEVIENLNKYFKISNIPNVKKSILTMLQSKN
jgi:DNA uptake protein ComE-like DNA-binding protein